MPKVKINDVISKLNVRQDERASRQFINVFGRVVRAYLEYKQWVRMMIEKNGHYQSMDAGYIPTGFIKYITMIEEIEKRGLDAPIRGFDDWCGYEIDGYHRLVIWKELGHEDIDLVGTWPSTRF